MFHMLGTPNLYAELTRRGGRQGGKNLYSSVSFEDSFEIEDSDRENYPRF
jgi:hypothetical protein